MALQALKKERMIPFAYGNEIIKPFQLCKTQADCMSVILNCNQGDCKHICDHAEWQITMLLTKAVATGVLLARAAVAIATDLGISNRRQLLIIQDHSAALAHCYVVGRIKADRGKISECADHLAVMGSAKRIHVSSKKRPCLSQSARIDRDQTDCQGSGRECSLRFRADSLLQQLELGIQRVDVDIDEPVSPGSG